MAVRKVMNLGIEITLDNKGAITGIKQVENAVVKSGKSAAQASAGFNKLKSALGGLGVAVGAAGIIRGVNSSVKAFADFEQQLKNVQNITGMSNIEMGEFKKQIEGLPSAMGSSVDLTKGLYQALSSGIPKENVIGFIETNAKAAKGNLADLTQTISASASIMNAFGLEGDDVNGVLDSMTKTVDLGVLTFGDLANNIGKASAMAANAGISYEEMFASVAQLTKGGLSTEESVTGLRAAIVGILKPTDDAAEAAANLGIDMSAARLKAEGLAPIMADIGRVVGDDAEAMATLFPNIRALGPALTLAKDNASGFIETFEQIGDSGGKVEENFANMSMSVTARMEAMKVEIQKMMQALGEELAPTVLKLGDAFMSVLPHIGDLLVTLGEYAGHFVDSMSFIADLIAPLVKFSGSIEGLNETFAATAVVLGIVKLAMMAVAGTMGPITAAILAAAAALAGLEIVAGRLEEKFAAGADEQNNYTKQLELMSAGMKSAEMTTQQMIEALDVKIGAEESHQDAILRTLQEQEALGIITEEYAAILHGTSVKEQNHVKALEASKAALAETAKLTEANADAVKLMVAEAKKLSKEMQAFNKEQEKIEKQSTKMNKAITDGFTGNVTALEGYIDALTLADLATQDLTQSVEVEFDELDRAIQLHMAENSRTIEDMFPDAVKDGLESAEDLVTNHLPDLIPPSIMEGPKSSVFNGITGGISEALGAGFTGEWDSFRDLWDSLWQDAAKSMTGFITDGLGMALNGKDANGNPFGFGDLFGGKDVEGSISSQAGIGSTIGGLGMVMQGREQGGAQGALQGAMGGMMAGAIAGPIGMAVGAVAGAAIAYFGGKDDPWSSAAIGNRNSVFSSNEANRKEEDVMEGRMRSLYDAMEAGYRGIFLSLGDSSLARTLRQQGRVPVVDTGGAMDMTPEELYEWLAREALPDAFESYYRPVLEQGLGNLGVNNGTLDALFDQLPDMTGDARIQFLADFVDAVVGISDSLKMADWDTFVSAINQDSMTTFMEGINETTEQMDLMMGSWRGMGLDDIVREVDAIGEAFDQALEGVAQMLHQIDGLRSGIQDGWAAMREDLKLSQMTDQQKIGYYQSQVDEFMADLQNAQTPEEIERANNALSSAMSSLMNLVDPAAAMGMGFEGTWGDYLDGIMQQASDTATAGLDAIEAEVREAYDELVERLERASDALLNFADATEKSATTTTGEGYYDPVTGEWVSAGTGNKPGESDNTNKMQVTTPITLTVKNYIDGQEMKSEMYAEVNSELNEMYQHILELVEATPAIS